MTERMDGDPAQSRAADHRSSDIEKRKKVGERSNDAVESGFGLGGSREL